MPRIVARGLLNLRHKAMLPQLVNSDFNAAAARRGAIIDVPLSQPIEAEEVVPAATPPAPPSQALSSVPITLNQWRKAAFYLTDQEMDQIEAHDSFIPLQMGEAISALARAVNDHILTLMHETEAFIGTVGRAFFHQSPPVMTSQALRQGCAPSSRHAIASIKPLPQNQGALLSSIMMQRRPFSSHPHAQGGGLFRGSNAAILRRRNWPLTLFGLAFMRQIASIRTRRRSIRLTLFNLWQGQCRTCS